MYNYLMKTRLPKVNFPSTLVGIDVETTSLDPKTGEIIEVAAIRFDSKTGQVIDHYVELCRPSNTLSSEITAITHITPAMVADKQPFAAHLPALKKFIAQDLVFAHNASFDIGFLTFHGLKITNPVWDTFALASIAWPETESYNLGLLYSAYVDVPASNVDTTIPLSTAGSPIAADTASELGQEHRAGYDVMITWRLLQTIHQKLAVSKSSYKNINHALAASNLSHYLPVFTIVGTSKSKKYAPVPSSFAPASDPPNLSIKKILGPRGVLPKNPQYVYREQQLQLAESIEAVFNADEIALMEAGTGTGKTFGYLVPLILKIINQKINKSPSASRSVSIVSTYTKHLQDQLFDHDIPELLRLLGVTIKVAILKGRRNYLCTGRLEQALQKTSFSQEEALFLIKLVVWLEQAPSGDLERLNLSHQTARYTYHLHADSISCRHNCPSKNPTCPYNVARSQARQADLIIVNHSLLVQLGTDESVFALDRVVIDEAHHLEDAARDATARDLSAHMLAEVVAPFVQLTKKKHNASLQRVIQEAQSIINEYQLLLANIAKFLTDQARIDVLRLNPSVRCSTKWQRIVEQGIAWRSRLQFIIGLLQGMTAKTSEEGKRREAIAEAENFSHNFESFLHGDPTRIQWLELSPASYYTSDNAVNLYDVALSVQPLLANLLNSTKSIVLTSATLTIGGKYDYIKRRLGINEAKEYVYGSSFDYKKQMLIYIVDDAPTPYESSYGNYLTRQFINLSKLTSGRLLGLFTSHQAVKDVYYGTNKELNKANIKLLAQKLTGGRHNMIKKFQQTHSSILLGTYSFWEGIDIPGESLSTVVIVKLPFSPPHDPVIDAIAEEEKISSFTNLSVPTMILRLRQGIGRLIRSQNDYGVVIILDPRFLQQDYGQQVISSLPPATVHIGSTSDLNPTLKNWFGEKQLKKWKSELTATK